MTTKINSAGKRCYCIQGDKHRCMNCKSAWEMRNHITSTSKHLNKQLKHQFGSMFQQAKREY